MAPRDDHRPTGKRPRALSAYFVSGAAGLLPEVRHAFEVALDAADLPAWVSGVLDGGGWDRIIALATLAAGVVAILRGIIALAHRFRKWAVPRLREPAHLPFSTRPTCLAGRSRFQRCPRHDHRSHVEILTQQAVLQHQISNPLQPLGVQ